MARRVLRTNDTEYKEMFEENSWTFIHGFSIAQNHLGGNRSPSHTSMLMTKESNNELEKNGSSDWRTNWTT